MAKSIGPIDKVRASRDGHEFHEAWTARRALQLLMPTDGLVGIAVEGLSSADNQTAASESVEIADLTLYYGRFHTFEDADRVVILQFKYSLRDKRVPFRMSDVRETVRKFAVAFNDHKSRHGVEDVSQKLAFNLITNRPVHPSLEDAIRGIAAGKSLKGEAKRQANQFKQTCGFKGAELAKFAGKMMITGLAASLGQSKRQLSRTLVDWSSASDAMARASLGGLRELVRDKAGSAGQRDNVIRRTDVIDALGLQGVEDLFPCPASFPATGEVVAREQLNEVAALIPRLKKSLLIHAAGGVGKTVFLQSLAGILAKEHHTVLFDCFGGGAYRAPDDSRHLPKHGLVHIVNTLACEGLCDPLLPTNTNVEDLVRAARRRFGQVADTLKRRSPKAQLLIFIDAIDNAAIHAQDKKEECFPRSLLESFHYGGRIRRVQLVVSCRTERRNISIGEIPCEEVQLRAFSEQETREYLRARVKQLTITEARVAFARSNGNPRVLKHLALSDRGLLEASEISQKIELDGLLRSRIQNALKEAISHGYKKDEIDAFLAGLAVLPPPVPPKEYADTYEMDLSAIESFAADLAPLLERTEHGLMFRDEPTETLIRDNYASDIPSLQRVAKNLFNRQGVSVYAASALPGLLNMLDDGELLFKLAFDDRFPQTITSRIGKQTIRYARLKAAVLQAASKSEHDRLVHLLVELSTIAASNQRGAEYILENPDLVVAFQDVDAIRRLFETRTAWQGTRHSRLAIANLLSQQLPDAERHARMAWEWIYHSIQQDEQYGRDKRGPERQDIAAVSLCLISLDRPTQAVNTLHIWKPWYAFEACEPLFRFLNEARFQIAKVAEHTRHFLRVLRSEVGPIAAALSFQELDGRDARHLIRKLSKALEGAKAVEVDSTFYLEKRRSIVDGLLKASAIALAMNSRADALRICTNTPAERPRLWSFTDWFSDSNIFHFVCRSAILALASGEGLTERTILPTDLLDLCSDIPIAAEGEQFRSALKKQIEVRLKEQDSANKEKKSITHEFKYEAEGFIDQHLEPLLELLRSFGNVLSRRLAKADKAFLKLVETWVQLRKSDNLYVGGRRGHAFFERLGRKLSIFTLWSRSDLKAEPVRVFLARLNEGTLLDAPTLIEIAGILAMRSELHDLAGETALAARRLIESENEVGRRASLYAQLARAILPASGDEAASYFRAGLEQLDAVGSGDYQFTYELLVFAASIKEFELQERDFHRLTNICELNMPEEAEKFPWSVFARGLSRVAGCKGLAKLSRWDDRSQVSLDITLLPYLAALLEDNKIEPDIALGLLRLSDSVELWECNTAALATIIHGKRYANAKSLMKELIRQFQENNPGVSSSETLKELTSIAHETFGKDEEESKYLSTATTLFKGVINEQNANGNYHGKANSFVRMGISPKAGKRQTLKRIVARTLATNEVSISKALDQIGGTEYGHNQRAQFLTLLRQKVKFSQRVGYIRAIARLDDLNIYVKLTELAACKEMWTASSAGLDEAYKEIGIPLVQTHADDFISNDRLSEFHLREIVNLCGIPKATLTLELIRAFAAPDTHISGAIWMALASDSSRESKTGEGQEALKRLLNSGAIKLTSSVSDGDWRVGLYPDGTETDVAAGLVWQRLGSPSAGNRWRAAHSVRCFARFGKWDVIDAIVSRFASRDAGPFQAQELQFYFLHARLWLLIALARAALDHPAQIARYEQTLKDVALDVESPHVLARHFAAQALISAWKSGNTHLAETEIKRIESLNVSPFPKLIKKTRGWGDPFDSRPASLPNPLSDFHLDYDFTKSDVHSLALVFGKTTWEVKDLITEFVRLFDASVSSMYEKGGRDAPSSRRRHGSMTSDYHFYGEQLGWNCLFLAAGRLLERNPVTNDSYYDDPWPDWLNRNLLTRADGLWLADGVDITPLETQVNLLEQDDDGLVITGNRRKLLGLVGISSGIGSELVVEANWSSPDDIQVDISSALVSPSNAKRVALRTAKEEPFRVWLPTYQSAGEEEYQRRREDECKAWIVCPSIETRLDADDPLGASCAVGRPYFAKEIKEVWSLKPTDRFNRTWVSPQGDLVARAHAWGRGTRYEDGRSSVGLRLICSCHFLQEVLVKKNAELLVLVRLQRYESGTGSQESRFWHTISVLRIKQSLHFEYYKGCINELHKNRF